MRVPMTKAACVVKRNQNPFFQELRNHHIALSPGMTSLDDHYQKKKHFVYIRQRNLNRVEGRTWSKQFMIQMLTKIVGMKDRGKFEICEIKMASTK